MPDTLAPGLNFFCFNCGFKNHYPPSQIPEESHEIQEIVKRCLNCSTEQIVEVPPGVTQDGSTYILRSIRPKDQ